MGIFDRFRTKPSPPSSFVITDFGGELLNTMGATLADAEYRIKVINFVDPTHSHAYNPYEYIRDINVLFQMVDWMIEYTTPSEGVSDLQKLLETALLKAICCYLYDEAPFEEQQYSMVVELLRCAEKDYDTQESDTDLLFNYLRHNKPDSIALSHYDIFTKPVGKRRALRRG